MKKIFIVLAAGLVLLTTACNNNTYSNLRAQEDKLIANYICRNNITVLREEPSIDHVWAENEYYDVSVTNYGHFYFHLIERGPATRVDSISPTKKDTVDMEIVVGDVIVARYKMFGLKENADTLSYWTTLDQAYPFEFHYGNMTECDAAAWHAAIRLMKYPESKCQMIVPSKTGFSTEQQTVTPYVYILKIKVKQ